MKENGGSEAVVGSEKMRLPGQSALPLRCVAVDVRHVPYLQVTTRGYAAAAAETVKVEARVHVCFCCG